VGNLRPFLFRLPSLLALRTSRVVLSMTCHHDGRWSLLMPMRCKHFAAVILTTLVFRSLFAQGFDHDGSMQKTLELEGQQLLESVGDDTTESEIYYLDDLADRFESNYRDAYVPRVNLIFYFSLRFVKLTPLCLSSCVQKCIPPSTKFGTNLSHESRDQEKQS